jgi:hypothetical protein
MKFASMNKVIAGTVTIIFFMGCQENEPIQSDFTGNEVVYPLQAGSVYQISGTATFKERKDGNTNIVIELTGTEGALQHPVHLHLGNISAPGAEVAASLNPVLGSSGKSETTFSILADETPVKYEQLIALNACIKIHLAASGPDRDIILAGGNIGIAEGARIAASDQIGICKSE